MPIALLPTAAFAGQIATALGISDALASAASGRDGSISQPAAADHPLAWPADEPD